MTQVQIPALPLTGQVNLCKLLSFSVPQFPHLQNEGNNSNGFYFLSYEDLHSPWHMISVQQMLAII